MIVEIYEIIKEYEIYISGFSHTIKGKISKKKDENVYRWNINYHGVYHPSKLEDESYSTVENLLLMYLNSFTNLDITKNDYY